MRDGVRGRNEERVRVRERGGGLYWDENKTNKLGHSGKLDTKI